MDSRFHDFRQKNLVLLVVDVGFLELMKVFHAFGNIL
jgi:hypothetical protein